MKVLKEAVAVIAALLERDEKKACDWCDKIQWGASYHAEKCPFGMAYMFLKKHKYLSPEKKD